MRYFMFIDESGEANILKDDPRFNIFVLCGIIFREDCYNDFNEKMKVIKRKFFSNTEVVFHSFQMRNKTDIFKIFQNQNILSSFYVDIGELFTLCDYKIIATVIDKQKYRSRYADKNFAYEDSLTFLVERAISMIGKRNKANTLHLCLEKRSKQKDTFLKKHYTKLISYGTDYVSTSDFRICHPQLHFRGKHENINGLQMADLCAYPIARKILSPETPQPTYKIFEGKFFCNIHGKYKGLGLKFFP